VATRSILVLVVIAGCSTKGSVTAATELRCPTGRELDRDGTSGSAHWAYDVTAEVCVKDRWSRPVIDCLNTATDTTQADRCYDMLTPAQQRSLEDALAAVDLKRTQAGHLAFLEVLEPLHTTPGAFHDAPECAAYRKTMATVFGRAAACPSAHASLLGGQALYERAVRALVAMPADRAAEVSATCARKTQELLADAGLQCR
jgi:hypothetical protein